MVCKLKLFALAIFHVVIDDGWFAMNRAAAATMQKAEYENEQIASESKREMLMSTIAMTLKAGKQYTSGETKYNARTTECECEFVCE